MKKIETKVVADSLSPQGHRITSVLVTFPRFILAELNTHRMFSKNSASSRAIPFEKMVKMVEEDPFVPIAWQKDHKGMQGVEYITGAKEIQYRNSVWLGARDCMIRKAKTLNDKCSYPNNDFDSSYEYGGVTKQLCNRLLEPFMWHTCLITATEWENFFNLRCPKYYYEPENKYFRSKRDFLEYAENAFGSHIYIKDEEWRSINSSQAEIHMQALAESMWDAINESVPKELEPGDWHIPFGEVVHDKEFLSYVSDLYDMEEVFNFSKQTIEAQIKVAVARCARLSYNNFDGEIDYKKDIELHDRLLADGHLSPFEHCARALTEDESDYLYKSFGETDESFETGWCDNFRGWMSYRFLIEKGE